jgi:tetratricopeptide (TPR) repeat protein
LIVIIAILSLSGVFSHKTPSDSTISERGIAITPRSAKAFLTNPDIERWAVIVGISDYKNNPQITDLKYADCDATAFYDFLVSAKGGCFKPENIQLLLNEKSTVSNLRYALGTFLGKTADKDLVVIYMAGHGAPDTRKWENLYFLTYDADPDSLPNTAYPMDDLTRDLQRYIKAKKVIVITDACHSAAVSGGMVAMRGNEGYRVNEYMKKLAESREGCTFITASRAGEGSQESEKWSGGHGVFTHFLLEGLKGKADYNGDGFITMKEAYDYLYPKVQRESENGQTPFASAYLDNSIPMGICDPDKLGIISKLNLPLQTPKKNLFDDILPDKKQPEQPLKISDAEAYYNLGITYYDSKDHQKAIESFKQVIRIKPDYAEAHCSLGNAYLNADLFVNRKKAIESFKEAIRLNPNFAEAHYGIGMAYSINSNPEKAIESYKEAIRLKPDYAEAHNCLGLAYEGEHDYQAIESLKQAIRLNPKWPTPHANLGRIYYNKGDRSRALDEYNILKGLDKEMANTLFNILYEK